MIAALGAVPLLPLLAGPVLWWTGERISPRRRATALELASGGVLSVTGILALVATLTDSEAVYQVWTGVGMRLAAVPVAGAVAVVAAVIAAVVTVYGASHEQSEGLPRLVGLLVSFTGAMLLLVLADDLLTLLVGWELVAAFSWGLIGHRWRDAERPRAAAHAFNATRLGALGLFLAAGAVFGATGSFAYRGLAELGGSTLQVAAGSILFAAIAKSAQVPFSPWLFSAMAGPTPVSALLHSSTMVAAGAYALIRLEPFLSPVAWFGPALIGVGLTTAITGGAVALLQGHVKKLLAASTSAQYGLMLVAIGSGFPLVALLHLVAHALFKAQLFLSAGIAIHTADSEELADMRVGGSVPLVAALTWVGSLALAGVPPLGAAWSKEEVVAAAGHRAAWLAVMVALVGGLSALYSVRFQRLAFGDSTLPTNSRPTSPPGVEVAGVGILAAACVGLGLLWLPPVSDRLSRLAGQPLPPGAAWELWLSLGLVGASLLAVLAADRAARLPARFPGRGMAADWLGLPELIRALLVEPALRLSTLLAAFDARVVDAGVRAAAALAKRASRGLAWLAEPSLDGWVRGIAHATLGLAATSAAADDDVIDRTVDGVGRATFWGGGVVRRIHTGLISHQYVVIAAGVAVVVIAAVAWR